jgi:hypothetical protein
MGFLLHRSPSLRDAGSQWPKRPFGLAIAKSSVTTKSCCRTVFADQGRERSVTLNSLGAVVEELKL